MRTEAERVYARRWYRLNRKHVLARVKERREANPEQHRKAKRATMRRYHARYRVRKLMKLYSLSEAQVHVLDRIKRCEICGRKTRLDTDHDHKTNHVRGRLCSNCNQGIGRFKDSPKLLVRAAFYLKRNAYRF